MANARDTVPRAFVNVRKLQLQPLMTLPRQIDAAHIRFQALSGGRGSPASANLPVAAASEAGS
jgi:hypothetical protein